MTENISTDTAEELARQAKYQADQKAEWDIALAERTAQILARIALDPLAMATSLAALSLDWGSHVAEVGIHFNCGEVERLCDLFTALGEPDTAQHWRVYHCEDDDEGDLHWDLREQMYAGSGLRG